MMAIALARTVTEAQVASTLASLVMTCADAEAGYASAARAACSPPLKEVFVAREAERRRLGAELTLLLAELGPSSVRTPPTLRLLGWVSETGPQDDRSLLERCDRGETACRKAYEAALRELPLFLMPRRVRSIVQRHYATLLASHAALQKVMWGA